MRAKSPTNCDAHLAESLFQTRSRAKVFSIIIRNRTITASPKWITCYSANEHAAYSSQIFVRRLIQ
ncbi:MAG: DUF6783 domain-containing protein [Blautia faecis]